MSTRRALLASAAIAPLLAAGLRTAEAQVETPEAAEGTPGATPQPQAQALPDLSGVTPLPLTGELLATFEAYVASTLAEAGVPGASVAVVQGGEVAFAQGFGVRELRRPAPVTADTLLRIGSVTKSFSSMLAATLVDAGRLTWDTPLVELLPGFAVEDVELTPRLTVRDAFCACSGLPRRDLEFIFNAQALTPELMIASMAELPLTAPFGEKYQYNNQLVGAGGFAVAVADGGAPDDLSHAYAIALRERVLNPIGMPRTTAVLSEVVAGNNYALPHAADAAGALQVLPLMEDDTWLVSVAPSGALWSSAEEMARYVQTELRHGVSPDGVRVVSAENLERTWQQGIALQAGPGTPPDMAAFAGHYGLGWVVGSYGRQRMIWHSGGTLGFTSLVSFLPEADVGVVVLTNGVAGTASSFTYAVTFRLLELLFDQPATFGNQLAASIASAAQGRSEFEASLGDVDLEVIAPYLGRYTNPDLGPVTLAVRADTFLINAGGFRSELRPLLDDDGAVTGYVLMDPPLGGYPPQATLTFEQGTDSQPRMVLTAPIDPGEADLVYTFDLVDAMATPTP
jgi:CubicO group peptidase (beta-lactamase class C family)